MERRVLRWGLKQQLRPTEDGVNRECLYCLLQCYPSADPVLVYYFHFSPYQIVGLGWFLGFLVIIELCSSLKMPYSLQMLCTMCSIYYRHEVACCSGLTSGLYCNQFAKAEGRHTTSMLFVALLSC